MSSDDETSSTPRPARHRAGASYARGEETRKRIVAVAIRVFGERGFEGASTREIAKAAGVNAPALQYYFDSKEGLYQACGEHIAALAVEHFSPVVEEARTLLADEHAPREALFEAFGKLLDTLVDHHLLSEHLDNHRLFMAQEQARQESSPLFEMVDRKLGARTRDVSLQLVARYCGIKSTDSELRLRVMMLYGQVMGFTHGRRTMLTKLGWERFGPKELAMIKRLAREQSRTLMDSWA